MWFLSCVCYKFILQLPFNGHADIFRRQEGNKKERKKGKYNVSKSQIICLFFSTFVFMYHLVGIKKLDVQILRLHLIWTLNKLSADGNAFRQCNRSREYCEFLKSEGKLYSFGSSKSDARITSTFFSAFQYILQTIFFNFQSSDIKL